MSGKAESDSSSRSQWFPSFVYLRWQNFLSRGSSWYEHLEFTPFKIYIILFFILAVFLFSPIFFFILANFFLFWLFFILANFFIVANFFILAIFFYFGHFFILSTTCRWDKCSSPSASWSCGRFFPTFLFWSFFFILANFFKFLSFFLFWPFFLFWSFFYFIHHL